MLEIIAIDIPKSAAVSVTLNPPVTLTIKSCVAVLNPNFLFKTVVNNKIRSNSTPVAILLGIGEYDLLVNT